MAEKRLTKASRAPLAVTVSCKVVMRCIPNTNLVIDSRRSSRVQSLLLSRTSAETSEARLCSSSCLSPLHLSSAVSAYHTDLSMRCYRQQVGVGGSHVGTVALGPNFGQFCLLRPLWSTGSTASCSSRASQRTTGCTHSSLNVYFSFRLGITGAYDALFACGFRC